MTNVMAVEGISKTYPDPHGATLEVLSSVTFSVSRGQVLAVVGPSGCGKSTLLRIIAGLEQPDAGRVVISGDAAMTSPPIIWQEHRLFPWQSVAGNVEFGLRIRGASPQEIDLTVRRLLDLMGLARFARYYPFQLSSGMAQRVAIARALAVGPRLLLMDEPFASVDALTKGQLLAEIRRLQHELDMTILYVTHDIRDAIQVSDHILVLTSRPARVRAILAVDRRETSESPIEREVSSLLAGS